MGIERFFSAINKNFDIVSLMSNIKKLKTDVFFIDFNSIIHYVSSKYIKDNYDENTLILHIKNYVDDLLENVECNLVYIALDGVPSISKILEQKKRSFIGDLIEELVKKKPLPFSFNKSLIKPGTKFMRKISEYLNFVTNPLSVLHANASLTDEPAKPSKLICIGFMLNKFLRFK